MESYLCSKEKKNCFGCEACKQICPNNAITMKEDRDGFRYPVIDDKKCIKCGLCYKSCFYDNKIKKYDFEKYTYGGYHKDWEVRKNSTSGGIFTAIVDAFCNENYIIFGVTSKGLKVYHKYIENKKDINIFRKSKYAQSEIGNTYIEVRKFLQEGKKVLFSGTPCQIAGLRTFLKDKNVENLLTVEVICEGVPTSHYMKKVNKFLYDKYSSNIKDLDYRYKDPYKLKKSEKAKWDFEVMRIELENGKIIKKDRWFNPFWKLWLEHLMSRPACYSCKFTNIDRVADITLGDLWGVHLYCPELYGDNGGTSLVICNTEKGKKIFEKAKKDIYGHELDFETALKYQGPMRKSIDKNLNYNEFMNDLKDEKFGYKKLIKKWYKKPSIKLLWSKYIWGNRQKIFVWKLKNRRFK